MRAALGVAFGLAFVTASGVALAQATQKQLVGGWTVTSVVTEEAGKKTEPYDCRGR